MNYSSVAKLRRFVAAPVERCDFCRARLPDEHAHLVENDSLRLFCACAQCARDMSDGFRLVEPHREALEEWSLDDADWASLQIPVDVAFLFRPEYGAEPAALFPGPAGTTRSQLSIEVWTNLVGKYPLLGELTPGAEAILVNRSRGRRDHYRVSTDHCYALAGLMRTRWRGLAGGPEAWEAIETYLQDLDRTAQRAPHA